MRKVVYLVAVMLLTGCVPIGVRVQNMLADATVALGSQPDASARSAWPPVS